MASGCAERFCNKLFAGTCNQKTGRLALKPGLRRRVAGLDDVYFACADLISQLAGA